MFKLFQKKCFKKNNSFQILVVMTNGEKGETAAKNHFFPIHPIRK